MHTFRSIAAIAAAAVALIFIFGTGTAAAQRLAVASGGEKLVTFNDNVGKNQFIWVSDAPLESIKGTSEGVSGTLTLDPQDLSKTRGTVSTAVCTMKTGNETRDRHLQSSEWLDGSRCTMITFTILSMDNVKVSGNTATAIATGNFTLHGVTKRMSIPFRMTYLPESSKTRVRAPGDLVMIAADFTISLKDFNVAGSDGAIGSKVGNTISITAQLFGNAMPKSTT